MKRNRPLIPNITSNGSQSDQEAFQNTTLRPILKGLHELIILFMSDYFRQKKGRFFKLTEVEKPPYLLKVFKTDSQLKLHLRAMVVGNFTVEEFLRYVDIKIAINKRMNEIILKRLLDSINELSVKE